MARADSLLRAGRLAEAESIYYAAVRAHPREYLARAALGDYLASRGHLKVATVLLEESRMFGADSGRIDRALAPLYLRLGDVHSLAALPAAVVSPGVHGLAQWLASHPSDVRLPESTAVVLRPETDTIALGSIPVTIGDEEVEAMILRRAVGLVINVVEPAAARAKRFGVGTNGPAVVDSLRIGDLRITNMPATIVAAPPAAGAGSRRRGIWIGLDVIGSYWPRVDQKAGRVSMTAGPPTEMLSWSDTLPTLLSFAAMRVVEDGQAKSASVVTRLRDHAWIYDQKRGVIWVSP